MSASKIAVFLVSAAAVGSIAYYTVIKGEKSGEDSPLNMEVPVTKDEEPEKTPETDSASGKTEVSVASEATTPLVSEIPADLKKRNNQTSLKSSASVSSSKRSFRSSTVRLLRLRTARNALSKSTTTPQ